MSKSHSRHFLTFATVDRFLKSRRDWECHISKNELARKLPMLFGNPKQGKTSPKGETDMMSRPARQEEKLAGSGRRVPATLGLWDIFLKNWIRSPWFSAYLIGERPPSFLGVI